MFNLNAIIPNEKPFIKFPLKPSQEVIKDGIINSIINGKKKIVLNGSAGTGKTTCVNAIIDDFREKINKRGNIAILAPTNKAVQVLVEKNQPAYWKQFMTVHQALNLKMKINESDGTLKFEPDKYAKNKPFKGVSLIAIDEASMLNSELLGFLNEYRDIPIIYLGDRKQLNPVGEAISPIFELKEADFFELTEIIRQGEGNPIIDLSQDIKKVRCFEDCINEVGGYRFVTDRNYCVNQILEDEDNTRYLAWTNANVDKMNELVRTRKYGANAAMIELGEILVMKEPYEGRISRYFTSQEFKVEEIKVHEKEFSIIFTGKQAVKENNHHTISLKHYLINNELLVIHEDSKGDYDAAIKGIKDHIKHGIGTWKNFYDFKEQFASVLYSYAITIHKS